MALRSPHRGPGPHRRRARQGAHGGRGAAAGEVREITAEYNEILAGWRVNAEELEPYHQVMYERTLAERAPMQRWVPQFR